MATADEYASWIVANRDKAGTPEFNTVAQAYQEAKASSGPSPRGFSGDIEQAAASGVVREDETVPIGGAFDTARYGARAFGQGMRANVGSLGDLPENLMDLGLAGSGVLLNEAFGRPDLMPQINQTGVVSRLLRQATPFLNNPPPADETQRMIGTGAQIAGGSVLPGAGLNTMRGFVKNVALPAAGGVVGEQMGGETGKLIGSIAAPMAALDLSRAAVGVPSGAASRAPGKRLPLGGPATVVEGFEKVGVPYSLAEVSPSRGFIQGLLDKLPIARNVSMDFAESQRNAAEKFVVQQISKVGGEADNLLTGIRIEDGIKKWKDATTATWKQLDQRAESLYPATTVVQPTRTMQQLTTITTPKAGAPATTAAAIPGNAMAWLKNLTDDVQQGNGITVEGLRSLRAQVGDVAFSRDPTLLNTAQQAAAKEVYHAINADLVDGARAIGPAAAKAVALRDAFYHGRQQRLEDGLNTLYKRAGVAPEAVVGELLARKDGTQLRRLMKSLEPGDQDTVVANVLGNLGKAVPNQRTLTHTFSFDTFLTNYNKLTPQAKAALFGSGRMNDLRRSLDDLYAVGSTIKEAGRPLANPPQTGAALGNIGAFLSFMQAPVKTAIGLVSAGTVEKLVTSKQFVRWLVEMAKNPKGDVLNRTQRLNAALGMSGDPELREAGREFISKLEQQPQGE